MSWIFERYILYLDPGSKRGGLEPKEARKGGPRATFTFERRREGGLKKLCSP